MPRERSYDEKQVRAILDRALRGSEGQARSNDLSHQQLLELGAEIGLSAESIERAALDVAHTQSVAQLEQRVIARRRRWFGHHLSGFLGVNGMLFLINFLTTPGQWWFLFPVVAWLLPLALHARFGLSRYVSERALQAEGKRAKALLPRVVDASERVRVSAPENEEAEAPEGEQASSRQRSGVGGTQ